MPLTVVNDLKTLRIFLEEMIVLWNSAQYEAFNGDARLQPIFIKECMMYADLAVQIVKESYILNNG